MGKINEVSHHIPNLNYKEKIWTGHDVVDDFSSYVNDIVSSVCYTEQRKAYNRSGKNSSFFCSPITSTEIIRLVNSMPINKAPGFDNISITVVKSVIHILCIPLTHIYNLCIANGSYPEKWKIAKVVFIYKNSDRTNPKNYRPISLLSILARIFEKLINTRIMDYITKNKLISCYQYAYQKSKSTSDLCIQLYDFVLKQLDLSNWVTAITLDISRAFDSVNHDILLNKLEDFGFRGVFNLFFKNRKKFPLCE